MGKCITVSRRNLLHTLFYKKLRSSLSTESFFILFSPIVSPCCILYWVEKRLQVSYKKMCVYCCDEERLSVSE